VKAYLGIMTPDQCGYVRGLRCGKVMHSWRAIAARFCRMYEVDLDMSGSPICGADLCMEAAAHFGENPRGETWN